MQLHQLLDALKIGFYSPNGNQYISGWVHSTLYKLAIIHYVDIHLEMYFLSKASCPICILTYKKMGLDFLDTQKNICSIQNISDKPIQSERQRISNLDDFCLNESESTRFPFELVYPFLMFCSVKLYYISR